MCNMFILVYSSSLRTLTLMLYLCSYNELMWEPGLWSVDTKIHFIREVYWCIDNKIERENTLKQRTVLA